MASVIRNLVEGIGIANSFPDNPKYFTQLSVEEILTIPTPKPDMEQLLSVTVDAQIESAKLIETTQAISTEGQFLSGCKLVMELRLKQKVKYVADEPTQTVHAAHFENLKSVFIIVPCEVNGVPIKELFDNNRIYIKPYIEDIYSEMLDKRTVFKNIIIFINAKIVPCFQVLKEGGS